jgi:hypothetical protein
LTHKRSRLIFVAVAIVFLAVIGSAIPRESAVVPAWKIRVVDEAGKPYVGLQVRQAWKHYSLELEGGRNMEDRWTDASGYVEFPARTLRLSLLSRAYRLVFTSGLKLLHGSTGIQADVAATGPQGYESVRYVPGKLPPERLVLPRKDEDL